MRRVRLFRWSLWVVMAGCLVATDVMNAQQLTEAIGIVTSVHGSAVVTHAGSSNAAVMAAQQPILFDDVIETAGNTKTKTLFQDDSMLAMGENTKIEIAEYVYDPDQQVRRMIVKLIKGRVRALVGRSFAGQGSMFEVRTGTATVVTQSTYFVVWNDEQETGVVNIGTVGLVGFTSGGRTISIEPGHYSVAPAGKAPALPVASSSLPLPAAHSAITGTDIKDDLSTPLIHSVDQDIEDALKTCPPDSPPGGMCPRKPPASGVPPATPPAVTSGAGSRRR